MHRLGHQRPPGEGDRRRGRGQAPRDRRQADPARGGARRPLGADRLRRDRRARPARGGAPVLRPRAAVARLPRRSSCPPMSSPVADRPGSRRLVLLRHGQTAWNAERRAQGHADVELDDTGRVAGRRGRAVRRGDAAARTSGRRTWPAPARPRACVAAAAGLDAAPGRSAPRVPPGGAHRHHHGRVRRGAPRRVPRLPLRPLRRRPRGRDDRAGRGPRRPTACAKRWPRWSPASAACWSVTAPPSRCRCSRSWAGRTSWPPRLEALHNCCWAELRDSGVDGGLRLSAYNRRAERRSRFRFA